MNLLFKSLVKALGWGEGLGEERSGREKRRKGVALRPQG